MKIPVVLLVPAEKWHGAGPYYRSGGRGETADQRLPLAVVVGLIGETSLLKFDLPRLRRLNVLVWIRGLARRYAFRGLSRHDGFVHRCPFAR